MFGGFEVHVLGLPIRARTPTRMLFQFVAAAGLLLAVSPRMRDRAAQLVRSPVVFFFCVTVLAMWLSLGPMPSDGDGRARGFGIYAGALRLCARLQRRARAGTLRDDRRSVSRRPRGIRRHVPFSSAEACEPFVGEGVTAWQCRVLILLEGAAVPMEINRVWNMNEAMPPARVYPATSPSAPPVYARIAALPPGSVITEFPFGDMAWEIRYVYYSAAHWKPIANGYSGAFPPAYKERLARLQRVTADPEAAWQSLRDSEHHTRRRSTATHLRSRKMPTLLRHG